MLLFALRRVLSKYMFGAISVCHREFVAMCEKGDSAFIIYLDLTNVVFLVIHFHVHFITQTISQDGSFLDVYDFLGGDGACVDKDDRTYVSMNKDIFTDNDAYTDCTSQCAQKVCAEICNINGFTANYHGFQVRTRNEGVGNSTCMCLYTAGFVPRNDTLWAMPDGVEDPGGTFTRQPGKGNEGEGPIVDKANHVPDIEYLCYSAVPLLSEVSNSTKYATHTLCI